MDGANLDTLARAAPLDAARAGFEADVVRGLSARQKSLPCRYFYDARGSELFEEITRLPEYYPTVTELGILERHVGAFARTVDEAGVLVEFGSGSSTKTELLLEALPRLTGYVPIDVSASALELAADRLRQRFPGLDIRPVVGDFSKPLEMPSALEGHALIGFFPGSTIGNFAPDDGRRLLAAFRTTLGANSRLLVGADLRKDVSILIPAYDDAAGVTAAFNLNLLVRINRELGGDFDLACFQHEARYDKDHGRIEMHLVSTREQVVSIGGHRFSFRRGESIHTENSYKFTVEQFQMLAAAAGWRARDVWTDDDDLFSVHDLTAA